MNLNYSVSVTSDTISDLPWYISNWHINTATLISVGGQSSNYLNELTYIRSLGLKARLDIEMDIWAGGNITSPISNFAAYLSTLKQAGWAYVCSEGGRSGDPSFIWGYNLGYVNYNCDQCGLWKDIYKDNGTILNLWECYYPNEVQYILTGAAAASNIPNGVLAGAWSNSSGDNQILANSINGTAPSYKSILDSLVATPGGATDFEVWGGINSSRAQNEALGFDTIMTSLQKYYPPNPIGSVSAPITMVGDPVACGNYVCVKGSDGALWYSADKGVTWKSLGGQLKGEPAVTSSGDFYAIGTDGSLYWTDITGKWHSRGKRVQ